MLGGRGGHTHGGGKAGGAKPALEGAVQRYPEAPNGHYAYGVYLLDEQPDRGIEELKQELKVSQDHIPSILQIAFEYLRRSDWDAARPWAQRAVELDPRDFTGRRALGQVLLGTRSTAESISHLENSVRPAPDSPLKRFNQRRRGHWHAPHA